MSSRMVLRNLYIAIELKDEIESRLAMGDLRFDLPCALRPTLPVSGKSRPLYS